MPFTDEIVSERQFKNQCSCPCSSKKATYIGDKDSRGAVSENELIFYEDKVSGNRKERKMSTSKFLLQVLSLSRLKVPVYRQSIGKFWSLARHIA